MRSGALRLSVGVNIGALRHRVRIEQRPVQNQAGVNAGQWTELCTVWADIEDLSGREYFAQQQIAADVTTRITMRWHAGIMPQMRAISVVEAPETQRVWDIQSVINPDGLHRELQLMCKERLGQAT